MIGIEGVIVIEQHDVHAKRSVKAGIGGAAATHGLIGFDETYDEPAAEIRQGRMLAALGVYDQHFDIRVRLRRNRHQRLRQRRPIHAAHDHAHQRNIGSVYGNAEPAPARQRRLEQR